MDFGSVMELTPPTIFASHSNPRSRCQLRSAHRPTLSIIASVPSRQYTVHLVYVFIRRFDACQLRERHAVVVLGQARCVSGLLASGSAA